MDNQTPAESIKAAEIIGGRSITDERDDYFNPLKNPDVISIVKQKDGNWRAYGQKNNNFLDVRGVKPEDVLVEFLTHE